MVVKMVLDIGFAIIFPGVSSNEQDNCVHIMYLMLTPGMVKEISAPCNATMTTAHKPPCIILSQSSVEANTLREIDQLMGVEV